MRLHPVRIEVGEVDSVTPVRIKVVREIESCVTPVRIEVGL